MYSLIASTASSPTWFEVQDHGEQQHRVRLGGFFGPTWMSSLCTGLSSHGHSIERAHAVRAHDLSWMAELTLRAHEGATPARQVPYLALARVRQPEPTSALLLSHFSLEATDDHGGTLRLTVQADDVLGLLGSLLTQLLSSLLFPVEMHIETREGRAYDQFWLAALDGARPTKAHETALAKLLERERVSST